MLALAQAGLLNGKSFGFLPLKIHFADEKESKKYGWSQKILVIDKWLLLEYAVCFFPANQDILVESVGKGGLEVPDDFLKAMGVEAGLIVKKQASPLPAIAAVVPFTPVAYAPGSPFVRAAY